jgi:hypothetical protein
MNGIWRAAKAGDLVEVQRLVGQDPALLNARPEDGPHRMTPLMLASEKGHVGVVRWLLDQGAAINESTGRDWSPEYRRLTALWLACDEGRTPVVKLLLERGADPSIANGLRVTPLMAASFAGHVEVVRVLLGHPGAKATTDRRDRDGRTAVWWACNMGRGGVARALLESGADPTIAHNDGTTPMAIAKQPPPYPRISAEGRRECVAALEVRTLLQLPCPQHRAPLFSRLSRDLLSWAWWQEAERAYQVWKARQVADQQGSGAVAVRGGSRGEEGKPLLDYAVHRLKGNLFPDLMEYMG